MIGEKNVLAFSMFNDSLWEQTEVRREMNMTLLEQKGQLRDANPRKGADVHWIILRIVEVFFKFSEINFLVNLDSRIKNLFFFSEHTKGTKFDRRRTLVDEVLTIFYAATTRWFH